MKYKFLKAQLMCLILSASGFVNATLLMVEYTESQTVKWTGQVDTTLNTLTITSLTDNVGGEAYWTPQQPILFNAVRLVGGTDFTSLVSYDVDDLWNGSIAADWGFISQFNKNGIQWNEGVFTGNNSHLGWGLGMSNVGSLDLRRNESFFGYTPWATDLNRGYGEGVVTVNTIIDEEEQVASVPEPSTLAIFALGVIGLASRRFKKESL